MKRLNEEHTVMAKNKNKLKEDTYYSHQKPKSSILSSTFINRLNSLFGFRTTDDKTNAENEFEKKYGLKFVRVDLDNPAYRIHNAAVGSVYKSVGLNDKLERYFDAYLNETSTSYADISDRQKRINELSFAYYNDVYISRVCHLVANEATQQDVQDRIITIESPNQSFTEKTYQLLNQWGITQNRINKACFDLELYGEAFWAHKIGLNGIERIKPISVSGVIERLEFSPSHMAKFLAERDGANTLSMSHGSKISELVELLKSKATFDEANNLAEMFDDKLLGFELEGNILTPPWMITHFRFNSDNSEFYPYGRPPLLAALAPFKQSHSTMALQGLARAMNFPITMYKVKNTEGMLPAQAFELVNNVRQAYDNLGVSPAQEGSEVYSINTKMWVPEGLVDIDVKDSKTDVDFIEDLKNYQNRVAVACGVPLSYIDPTADNFEMSGVSLKEQWKPFARQVYSIQSAFLEGLGQLIRMHYAITGEFDYNTPFVVSMRMPAQEISDEERSAQSSSVDLAKSVIELIQTVLGISEEEPLPEDVVTDILSKYTFLNPTDLQKWIKLSSFVAENSKGADDGDSEDMEESYRNKGNLNILNERQKNRLKEISERYDSVKDEIYIKFMESSHLTEWNSKNTKTSDAKHYLNVPRIESNSSMAETFEVISNSNKMKNKKGYDRLKEELSFKKVMKLDGAEIKTVKDRTIANAIQEVRQMDEEMGITN